MKKILFTASEAVPFIKTGGLADVVGTLPKLFGKNEFDVRVILPKYRAIPDRYREQMQYKTHFYMNFAGETRYVGILELEWGGIKFYFVDNEYYFYGDRAYEGGIWDLEKFAFFSKAVLSALPLIPFQPEILHCHDWQTGLIPVYLRTDFCNGEFFAGMKSIMTIHNLKFQGVWSPQDIMNITGLPGYLFTPDKLEAYQNANYLKGGLVYADWITTVSPTYREEIKTEFFGEGLDGLLRARNGQLSGILNGIDYDEYNPETDNYLAYPYNAITYRKLKVKNKLELQKELGLKQDKDKFMIGIVSRLTGQKGLDLVEYMMEQICDEDTQLVVLGTGDAQYENMFRHYAWKYPDRVSANIFYSDERSHRIYGGCDAFLMPSLFEPCGLSQLMSLRYGTVPIVRETGGLKDTVQPYNEYESTGNGFSFTNYNAHDMMEVIRYAKHIYYDRRREWNKIIDRGMAADFSWKVSARRYEDLYRMLI